MQYTSACCDGAAARIGDLAFDLGHRLPDVAFGGLHGHVAELQVSNVRFGVGRERRGCRHGLRPIDEPDQAAGQNQRDR